MEKMERRRTDLSAMMWWMATLDGEMKRRLALKDKARSVKKEMENNERV